MGDLRPTREVARFGVELRWRPPRTWGPQRRLPHGGAFYAHAHLNSPDRCFYVQVQATGAIGPGGVEMTELAILTAVDDPSVPEIQIGEAFELVRARVAANGRVLRKIN